MTDSLSTTCTPCRGEQHPALNVRPALGNKAGVMGQSASSSARRAQRALLLAAAISAAAAASDGAEPSANWLRVERDAGAKDCPSATQLAERVAQASSCRPSAPRLDRDPLKSPCMPQARKPAGYSASPIRCAELAALDASAARPRPTPRAIPGSCAANVSRERASMTPVSPRTLHKQPRRGSRAQRQRAASRVLGSSRNGQQSPRRSARPECLCSRTSRIRASRYRS